MARHDLRGRAFARGGGVVHRKDEIHVSQKFGLLCTLRIDKLCIFLYNKARNQRSIAEAQMRANPADFKQKGARPMVDMEPAQFGQTVGIR